MRLSVFTLTLAMAFSSMAQVLTVEPVFFTEDDTITVTFNAEEGNKGLMGFSGDVYAHTGLITSKSTSGSDWKYVQGTWGTADQKVKMTRTGPNLYTIKYHLRSFYGLPAGEKAMKLAFVFRDAAGSRTGRSTDGSDIFYELPGGGFNAIFTKPSEKFILLNLNDSIAIQAASSSRSLLELFVDGTLVASDSGTVLRSGYRCRTTCVHLAVLKASSSIKIIYDTLYLVVPDENIAVYPNGAEDGITYLSDSKIRFSLYAPGKKNVYVLGDFNNWTPSCTYQMKQTPDRTRFWLEVSGFTPGKEYSMQYLVDGQLRIADPYSRVILDPLNDNYITSTVYPNLPKYPTGKTTGIVTLLTPGETPFAWKTMAFKRPNRSDLVVYELLVRDFVASHRFKTVMDSLPYLKKLGINCLELMPVMEFEGNVSWGYNVSFHGAVDKYYGTRNDLKALIDKCHELGISVVLDIALNHAFSQSSLCQLYWDASKSRPASDNPWLNPVERHPYNVGYDFNHESAATQYFVDHILKYWVSEFQIDGFRFDLSKGFTQTYTGSDVGAWGKYDQSRINLLKRMGQVLWQQDPGLFLILEHFAENSEEKVLSDLGFMLWSNSVYNYNECTMGYYSDLSWGSYKTRGWTVPNVVDYLESHDEERLMFKNLTSGNSSGSYSVKNLSTALKRMEMAGAIFFSIPGPKMFWQFGELGYDISRDQGGKLSEKPILWNYLTQPDRKRLYQVWSQLIALKTKNPVFRTTNYSTTLGGYTKTIILNGVDTSVVVLANSNVVAQNVSVTFPKAGTWYEYFSNDSITVTSTFRNFMFQPGEYRMYSSRRLGVFPYKLNVDQPISHKIRVFPNPGNGLMTLAWGALNGQVYDIEWINALGQTVVRQKPGAEDSMQIDISTLPAGVYFIRILTDAGVLTTRYVVDQ